MELVTVNDGWIVSMDDGRVERIEIDFRLGLLIGSASESLSLYIETPCCIKDISTDVTIVPGDVLSVSPVLSFFNIGVVNLAIRNTGQLTVYFIDGRTLHVEPHHTYEAWQASCENKFLMVCSPGGKVSLFLPDSHSSTKENGPS